MKQKRTGHGKGLLLMAVVSVFLVLAFWYGGDAPGLQGRVQEEHQALLPGVETAEEQEMAVVEAESIAQPEQLDQAQPVPQQEQGTGGGEGAPPPAESAPEPPPAESELALENKPTEVEAPVSAENAPDSLPVMEEASSSVCTVSIQCGTMLEHLDWVENAKKELIPPDGWILQEKTAELQEGDSVFTVLQRICKQEGILLEYSGAVQMQTAYIEGIGGLYEFDAGERSGWTYSVNGAFPTVGASQYRVEKGDAICWFYTCDYGYDVR